MSQVQKTVNGKNYFLKISQGLNTIGNENAPFKPGGVAIKVWSDPPYNFRVIMNSVTTTHVIGSAVMPIRRTWRFTDPGVYSNEKEFTLAIPTAEITERTSATIAVGIETYDGKAVTILSINFVIAPESEVVTVPPFDPQPAPSPEPAPAPQPKPEPAPAPTPRPVEDKGSLAPMFSRIEAKLDAMIEGISRRDPIAGAYIRRVLRSKGL